MWVVESSPFEQELCVLAPIFLNTDWFIIAERGLALETTFAKESILSEGSVIFTVFIHIIEMNISIMDVVDVDISCLVRIK